MPISGAFKTIANTIEAFERADYDITAVETNDAATTESAISLDLTISLDLFDDIELPAGIEIEQHDAQITNDGAYTVHLSITSPIQPPEEVNTHQAAHPARREEPHGGTDADQSQDASVAGAEDHQTSPNTQTADADESLPPHRDPDTLRQVYEAQDTFTQMQDALDTDVTANTVRRNMIKHGIHDPDTRTSPQTTASNATDHDSNQSHQDETADSPSPDNSAEPDSSNSDQERDIPLADGIDLPQGTTLEDVKSTVATSRTLLEVQRDLDIDRSHARRLLSELDLLDLVSGRLVSDADVSSEEIEKRIAGSAPSNA